MSNKQTPSGQTKPCEMSREEAAEKIRLSVIDYLTASGVKGDEWEAEKIRPILASRERSILAEIAGGIKGAVDEMCDEVCELPREQRRSEEDDTALKPPCFFEVFQDDEDVKAIFKGCRKCREWYTEILTKLIKGEKE